jgi:hypothetical protein
MAKDTTTAYPVPWLFTYPSRVGSSDGAAVPSSAAPPPPARHPARRWVIERTNSWHNRLRKLRIRYEKQAENYLGLVEFAGALIVYRLRLLLR